MNFILHYLLIKFLNYLYYVFNKNNLLFYMSDVTDLSIILIIVFGLIVYVSYIKKIIAAQYTINDKNCNPVTLFLNSIKGDPAEGVNSFAKCVRSLDQTPT